MYDPAIPNFLTLFFAVTTVGVILYPLIKLTPSWLERSMGKKVVLHRNALIALDAAIAGTRDEAQRDRLQAQRDYHQASIEALFPVERAPEPVRPSVDIAA